MFSTKLGKNDSIFIRKPPISLFLDTGSMWKWPERTLFFEVDLHGIGVPPDPGIVIDGIA